MLDEHPIRAAGARDVVVTLDDPPDVGLVFGSSGGRVTDAASSADLRVSVDGGIGSASPAVHVGEDQYATLLDFTAMDAGPATVTIEAIDQAGNVAQQIVTLSVPTGIDPPVASPTNEGQP